MAETWEEKWQKKSNFEKQENRLHTSMVFFRFFKDSHLCSKDSKSFNQDYKNLKYNLEFLFRLQFIIEKIKVVIQNFSESDEIVTKLKHDLENLKNNYLGLESTCRQRRGRSQCLHSDLCEKGEHFEILKSNDSDKKQDTKELKDLKNYLSSFNLKYGLHFKCQLKTSEIFCYSERIKFQNLKKKLIHELIANYDFSKTEIKALSNLDYRNDYYFITGELSDTLEIVNLTLKNKNIIENYLKVLNKERVIWKGLPFFDEFKKSSQQFIEELKNSGSDFFTKNDNLLIIIRELLQREKIK